MGTDEDELAGCIVFPTDRDEVFDTTEKLAGLLAEVEVGKVAMLAHHLELPEIPKDREYIQCKILPVGRDLEPGETPLYLFALEEDEAFLREVAETVITKVMGERFLGGGWLN